MKHLDDCKIDLWYRKQVVKILIEKRNLEDYFDGKCLFLFSKISYITIQTKGHPCKDILKGVFYKEYIHGLTTLSHQYYFEWFIQELYNKTLSYFICSWNINSHKIWNFKGFPNSVENNLSVLVILMGELPCNKILFNTFIN